MDAPPSVEEILRKIQDLESGHAHLKQKITSLTLSRPDPERNPHSLTSRLSASASPLWRRDGNKGPVLSFRPSSSSFPPATVAAQLMEAEYLNILQSMGQSVHIVDPMFRIIYWNRAAENLFGYHAAEALGKAIYEVIIDAPETALACDIINRSTMGESWTGLFPVRNKMGKKFLVICTTTHLYDEDGIVVGVVIVSSASRPFEEVKIYSADAKEPDKCQSPNQPIKSVTTKPGLDPDQPFQSAIASKLTSLASKVSDKVRSKFKTGEITVPQVGGSDNCRHSDHDVPDDLVSNHKKVGCSNGASNHVGDPASVVGVYSHVENKTPAKSQRESSDENERKTGIKELTSKAEAWLGKKKNQWSWKRNERDISEASSGRFAWPWSQGEQDAAVGHPNSSVKAGSHEVEYCQSAENEAPGFWSSFHVNSTSSHSSGGSSSSSVLHTLDMDSDFLDTEIMWEDLTVREQIGQGSCGTVYHGFWCGSDVAIKVFSQLEYSDDAILSFRQEVSLMKRLRHPNILLFMGAVTTPQRLCIVTEFLPRGSLFRSLQRSTSELDWRRRIHVAVDVARGMNYLHSCNPPVIHRDLKSSNLLVDKNWTVKVADFGLSRVKHETYLASKTGKGTPQWMAPELLRNGPVDEK